MTAKSRREARINGVDVSLSQLQLTSVHPKRFTRVFKRSGGELDLSLRPALHRFDDPDDPPAYAAAYVADGVLPSMFEARGILRPPQRGRLVVPRRFHNHAKVARYDGNRELNVFCLIEQNVNRIDAVDAVREADYPKCQAIAKAIYEAFPEVDGIGYVSRMYPPHMCWAIFDRGARDARLRPSSIAPLAEEPDYIAAVLGGDLVVAPSDD